MIEFGRMKGVVSECLLCVKVCGRPLRLGLQDCCKVETMCVQLEEMSEIVDE